MALAVGQPAGAGPSPDEAVDLLAQYLDAEQTKEGVDAGVWGPDWLFLGPLTGGMACAYRWTENPDYWVSAELGGRYILAIADSQGNLLGDEVSSFVQLSESSEDPANNPWRSALEAWYDSMRFPGYEQSTAVYLEYFDEYEAPTAVFYVAQHAVGAYYVDDVDKELWREALIKYLSHVDDESTFPVMSLGIATWALAEMDALNDSLVGSYEGAKPYWDEVALRDLPALLASHQVPEDEDFPYSFYWRFDHTSGGTGGVVAGYTEDAIYGALGLVGVAAYEIRTADPNATTAGESAALLENLDNRIMAVEAALLAGIDEDAQVYQHLSLSGPSHDTYVGEMLQVLCTIEEYLDARVETEPVADVEVEVAL
jgi:hypothetical protein